ncbi:hypothetical protein CAEBREN_02207 [Caenorhabditis brenneri]|uniref:Uncharacterized protein n=1 Tax=Caenorhabditis brenneri TaxID=135651 RepID=G0MM98_CAEBE|nr:hypothetical protein CAEBREN_02207 [Caenorhabditis brenneri]
MLMFILFLSLITFFLILDFVATFLFLMLNNWIFEEQGKIVYRANQKCVALPIDMTVESQSVRGRSLRDIGPKVLWQSV